MAMFEQKEVIIGGEAYYLKKFKAMKGLELQQKLMMIFDEKEGVNALKLDPEVIRDIVINGCTKGSINLDNKKFDDHFSGKLSDVMMLAMEIIAFNFFDPNVESDTEEK